MKDAKSGFAFLPLIIVVIALLGGGVYLYTRPEEAGVPPAGEEEGNQIACTMDAKQCPDGSYVGRVGPSCEFAACPTTADALQTLPAKTKISIKGTLAIYDSQSIVSALEGMGFTPLTWYLVPESVNFPGTPLVDTELKFDEKSECIKPADQYSGYQKQLCLSGRDFKWGYGDRVSIVGDKDGNLVLVNELQIIPFDSFPAPVR